MTAEGRGEKGAAAHPWQQAAGPFVKLVEAASKPGELVVDPFVGSGTTGLAAQQPFQVKVSGHGQPMILIPGLSSSGETWDTTVDHYKDRFECHVLTVAGFAGVPRVPATSATLVTMRRVISMVTSG